MLVMLLAAKWISKPIRQLLISAKSVVAGNYDDLPAVNSRDDVGELSKTITQIAESIKKPK
jgi:HAMP domain-containing protein